MKSEITGYWTFFCNPAKWEIDRFLQENAEYDDWQIMPWQESYFQTGQVGLVRVGTDSRSKKQLANRPRLIPGIYGIVEVVSQPKKRQDKPDKFWVNWTDKELKKSVVELRYLKNFLHNPIPIQVLKQDTITTRDSYLVNGFQASKISIAMGLPALS